MDNRDIAQTTHLCLLCLWYETDDGDLGGTCHQRPPTATGFPHVMGSDWCARQRPANETRKEQT